MDTEESYPLEAPPFDDKAYSLNQMSMVLVVYIGPWICGFGILFNLVCVCIFLSVSSFGYFRKTSLIFYLSSLFLCNATQLVLAVFVLLLPVIEQYLDKSPPWLSSLNVIAVRIGYPLMLAANYASMWLLVLTCTQRYQAICHGNNPWKHRLNWVRLAKPSVFIVIFLSLVLNIVRYWEMEWIYDNGRMLVANTPLRDNLLYKICQEAIIYGIFIYTVPMAILLFLNIATFPLIFSGDEATIENTRKSAEHRAAKMTFCIFLLFFLCITLSVSTRLFLILYGDPSKYMWMVDLSNWLVNFNALCSPFISFLCTRGFHPPFLHLLLVSIPVHTVPGGVGFATIVAPAFYSSSSSVLILSRLRADATPVLRVFALLVSTFRVFIPSTVTVPLVPFVPVRDIVAASPVTITITES